MEHDSSSIRFQFNEKPAAVQQVTGAQKKPDSEADRSTSKNEDVLFDTPTHYPGSPVLGVGEQFDELDAHRLYALDNGDKATFLEPISPRERSSSIDVVFVHGLSGDHRTTWSCGDAFWPQWLSDDLRTARVMLFHYDPRIWMQPSVTPISDTARNLLSLLSKSRLAVGKSSTVYIAHSLGGLLVKAAFNMEKDMHDDLLLDSMPLNTKQIIFFSTPHRAMSTRGWDRIYANIQEVAQEYSAIARSNSSSQHPNSTDLGSLLQEFDASLTPQTRILSMFEEHDAFNESGPVLITGSQNASFSPSEKVLYLPGNHVTVCRLQKREEDAYSVVRDAIIESASRQSSTESGSESSVRRPQSALELDLQQDLFRYKEATLREPDQGKEDSITVVPPSVVEEFAPTVNLRRVQRLLYARLDPFQARHSHVLWYPQDRLPKLGPMAGDLKIQVESWLTSRKLLFIHGPRGSGKSLAARTIVSHLDSMTDRFPVVLSYFSSQLMPSEKAVFQMMNKFLLQLLEINPSLIRHFPTRRRVHASLLAWPWDNMKPQIPVSVEVTAPSEPSLTDGPILAPNYAEPNCGPFSLLELTEILVSMLHDSETTGPRVIVIDAMDEGWIEEEMSNPEDVRQADFIQQMKQILLMLSTVPDAKVCVTWKSLPSSIAHQSVYDVQIYEIHREEEDATETMKRLRVSFTSPNTPSLDDRSLNKLCEAAQTLFAERRWSHLWQEHVERIATKLHEQRQQSKLTNFIAKLSTDGHEDPMSRIYDWLIHFWYDLPAVEFYLLGFIVLASRPLSLGETAALMSEVARGIDTPLQLRWPHDLHAQREEIERITKTSSFGFVTIRMEKLIVIDPAMREFCFRHLQSLPGHNPDVEEVLAKACLGILARYPKEKRFHYAAEYWDKHLRCAHTSENSDGSSDESRLSSVRKAFSQNSKLFLLHSDRILPPIERLPVTCILAAFDLASLLTLELSSREEGINEVHGFALAFKCAAINHAEEAFSVLWSSDMAKQDLFQHVEINLMSEIIHHGYAVHFASSMLPPRQLRMIWEELQDPHKNTIPDSTFPPVDEPFNTVDHHTKHLYMCLVWAVRTGNTAVAEKLLDNGYVGDTVDHYDQQEPTLLHLSAAMGHTSMVRILIENGARRRLLDKEEKRPIHWAAERAHNAVVALLVSPSSDFDSLSRSPLFSACEAKSLSTVKLLLSYGFDVNLRDGNDRSPLHVAAVNGSSETVRFLISRGADGTARDKHDITPLHLAAYGGWLPVAIDLLSAGVPVDLTNKSGQTPLHYACKSPNPSIEVIQFLLGLQANPNLQDSKGQTPLHVVCKNESVTVVKLLLEACSSPDLKLIRDKNGLTALDMASPKRNPAVFALLEQYRNQQESVTSADQITGVSFVNAQTLINEQLGSEFDGTGACVIFVHGLHDTPGVDIKESLPKAQLLFWQYTYEASDFLIEGRLEKLRRTFLEAILRATIMEQKVVPKQVDTTEQQQISTHPRSIIFVAHSVGGILVKSALAYAATHREFTELRERTRALAFLGTPHLATGLSTISDLIKGIFASRTKRGSTVKEILGYKQPSQDLLLSIHSKDEFLERLQFDFQALSAKYSWRVLLVGETLATDGSRLLVPPSAATYSAVFTRSLVLAVDHSRLSCIAALPEPGRTEVVDFLQYASGMISGFSSMDSASQPTPEIVMDRLVGYSSQRRVASVDDLLNVFTSESMNLDEYLKPQPNEVQSSLLPSKETANLSDHKHLITNWLRDRNRRLLWIKGKPGSGKTTLMRQLLRQTRDRSFFEDIHGYPISAVTAFFFFSRTDKKQLSPEDMVRGLLFQIFNGWPSLAEESLHKDFQGSAPTVSFLHNLSRLRRLFQDVIKRSKGQTYFLFVDAIDECESQPSSERDDTMPTLTEEPLIIALGWLDDLLNLPNVKVCIASRAWNSILDFCYRWHTDTVRLDDENTQDIKNYVETRLRGQIARHYHDDDRDVEHLALRIISSSHGLFVWARLITEQICRGLADGEPAIRLLDRVDTIPRGLAGVYEMMLSTISRRHLSDTLNILSLVASGQPPMDLVLLSLALEGHLQLDDEKSTNSSSSLKSNLRAVNERPNIQGSADFSLIRKRMTRQVIAHGGDFLEIVDGREVRFVHPTAREFVQAHLEQRPGRSAPALDLLSACIVRLKRYGLADDWEEPDSDGSRYVTDAIEYAKDIDNSNEDIPVYVRLLDELCKVSLNLYRSRRYTSTIYSPFSDQGSQQSLLSVSEGLVKVNPQRYAALLTPEQYAILLAVRNNLAKYIEAKHGQETLNLEDTHGQPLLVHALLPPSTNLPWTTPTSFWDLPEPKTVELLLRYGADPNVQLTGTGAQGGKTLWELVLEYGYHCFDETSAPFTPGPQASVRNKDRWVAIMEIFLKHNADTDAKATVYFGPRDAGQDAPSVMTTEETRLPTPKTIDVERAIRENLRAEPQYAETFRTLLNLYAQSHARKPLLSSYLKRSSLFWRRQIGR